MRRKTSPLQSKKARECLRWEQGLKAVLFFLVLYVGAVAVWILPLRPTYSDVEKRELTKFPEFSWDALVSGTYFDDISTWFSDTFPGRELWTTANGYLKNLYGVGDTEVIGNIHGGGEEIPEVPSRPTVPIPTDPAT